MFVNFNILNQLGSPAINSNTFANRPAAGQTGRLFVSTDTFEIYRDNGTTWDLIGGPGTSTITGTGTATQVAYFTSSQAIGSSANLYWDNTNTRLGIGTSTPGVRLDIHGTGNMLHINSTSATANALMSFQRTGTNVWRLGDQYNGGSNYFELHNTALANNAIQIDAATNKSILTSIESYSTGLARGNYLDYTLSLPNATTFTSPNTVTALGATLNLNIAGSATIPAGARSGADFFNGINFTSAGTFTVNQSTTIRAFSNVTAGWAFNGSAVGTVTHLAGLRILFPTNSGSAINVTDNYALLINNQNANTGTINYTNRWGIYQEGSSDLNYMAANLLLGSTVNTGDKLQVTGTTYLSSQLTVGNNTLYVDTVFNRVGINTNSPSYTLDVIGSGGSFSADNNGQIISKQALDLATAGGRFTGQSNRGSLGAIHIEQTTTGADGGYIEFRTSNSGSTTPTPKMRLDASGNLGIGTTSPSGIFHAQATNSGIFFDLSTAFTPKIKASGTISDIQIESVGNGGNVYLNAPGSTSLVKIDTNGSERMRITSGGNVGINGTPSSFSNFVYLDVIGNSAQGGIIQSRNSNNSIITALFTNGNGGNLRTETNHPLLFGTNSTEQMRIASGGNVLIGTTTDNGSKLQVSGSTTTTGQAQINTKTFVRQQNTTAAVSATTDIFRFLDNSGTLNNGFHAGILCVQGSDANTGANSFSNLYYLLTTSNGTTDSNFATIATVTRGVTIYTSIAIVNDGGGGDVKVQITTNATPTNGVLVTCSFLGIY